MSKDGGNFDKGLIRELAALLEETGLTEIEVEHEGKRIRVARGVNLTTTLTTTDGPAAPPSELRETARPAKRTPGPKRAVKKTTRKRSVNAGKANREPPRGAPPTDQDPKRRLGNFTGAGEAPRKGHRTTGIVGPQKKREAAKRARKKG